LLQLTFRRRLTNQSQKKVKHLEDELEELSELLELSWGKLTRRPRFHKGETNGFHEDNEGLTENAFNMLIRWKEKEADATYSVLYDALCHERVQIWKKRFVETNL